MAGGRVVLADDDVLLREGIARILAGAGYEVVGQADDATALDELGREQAPALVGAASGLAAQPTMRPRLTNSCASRLRTWSWSTSGCHLRTRPRVCRRPARF